MTKIKIIALGLLLALSTSKLPAPPSGGATCAQITAGWSCYISVTYGSAYQFNIASSGGLAYIKLYRDGAFYGQLSPTSFLLSFPVAQGHQWKVVGYSSVGGCIKDLGTFVL